MSLYWVGKEGVWMDRLSARPCIARRCIRWSSRGMIHLCLDTQSHTIPFQVVQLMYESERFSYLWYETLDFMTLLLFEGPAGLSLVLKTQTHAKKRILGRHPRYRHESRFHES